MKLKKDRKRSEIKNEDVMGRLTMISTDPFGSYTGVPLFEDETPVQDADDL